MTALPASHGIPHQPSPVDDTSLWIAQQSLWVEQHWTFDGELLRVQIKRNAYDDQSHATVCCWSPISRGWNHLAQLHILKLPISQASYHSRIKDSSVIALADRSIMTLISRATVILGARSDYWDRQG